MHTCGHQIMVTETSETANFWGGFFYNILLYWLAILLIGKNIFYIVAFFSGRWKKTNETNQWNNYPRNLFFCNTILYSLTNTLSHQYNFSLLVSIFLKEYFTQSNVFPWICTIFVNWTTIGCVIWYLIIYISQSCIGCLVGWS